MLLARIKGQQQRFQPCLVGAGNDRDEALLRSFRSDRRVVEELNEQIIQLGVGVL